MSLVRSSGSKFFLASLLLSMCFQKLFWVPFTSLIPAELYLSYLHPSMPRQLFHIPLGHSWSSHLPDPSFLHLTVKLNSSMLTPVCLLPFLFVFLHVIMDYTCLELAVLEDQHLYLPGECPMKSWQVDPWRSANLLSWNLRKNPRRYIQIWKYHSCFWHIFPPRTWGYFPTIAAKNLGWTVAPIKLVWKTKCCIKL